MPNDQDPTSAAAVAAQDKPSPYSFATLKEAATDFLADDALTQAAAVAYYTALSFAPLIVLVTLVVGATLGDDMRDRVVGEVQTLMGGGVGGIMEQIMASQEAEESGSPLDQAKGGGFGILTGIIGIAALIYSASGVFAQLQAALNKVWDVEAAPGEGLWGWLRKRLLSMGVVFSILFLLLASMAVTALLNVFLGGEGFIWKAINFVVSLVIYTALFALIFKFLPDVKIPLKAVGVGAAVTALLFALGKLGIGLYLSRGGVGNDYGGAGSLIVLLVWVYYSAIIVFFGAELTQVWAKRAGIRIRPDKHARPEQPKQKEPAHGRSDQGAGARA